jgi:GNAT superfamily N-acetyltransferase
MTSIAQQSHGLDITLLPTTFASDADLVTELTDLVNRVYAVAEAGLWAAGATRTTSAEMADMIAASQIAVARRDERTVGVVRVRQLGPRTGEFGLLVADPGYRGEGIGRDLVTFAEQLSSERGLSVMQLELLVPRGWTHPVKDFLHAWYTRLGYRQVRTGTIDEGHPHLAPLLATPCDYVTYHKNLAPHRR